MGKKTHILEWLSSKSKVFPLGKSPWIFWVSADNSHVIQNSQICKIDDKKIICCLETNILQELESDSQVNQRFSEQSGVLPNSARLAENIKENVFFWFSLS